MIFFYAYFPYGVVVSQQLLPLDFGPRKECSH